MNISGASKITGLSARMIRFYEAEAITNASRRGASGYRDFGPDEIANLRFIKNARDLGFELAEIRQLLKHWRNGTEAAEHVQVIVASRLAKLLSAESKIKASRLLLESILLCRTWRSKPGCELLTYLAAQSGPVAR